MYRQLTTKEGWKS